MPNVQERIEDRYSLNPVGSTVNGIQFTVLGEPVPQGSAKAWIPKGWTRAIITSDNKKLKPWRQAVSGCSYEAMQGRGQFDGAVEVVAEFFFTRPKSRKNALYKTTAPDIDKALRAILDGMTGVVFRNDAQVVQATCRKAFGSPARAEIQVREL